MNSPEKEELPLAREPNRGAAIVFSVASAKFGVILVGVLTVVLIFATLLDASKGLEIADWYVYKSAWFSVLLGLLSVNLLAAVLVRVPRNAWGATALVLSAAALFFAARHGDVLSGWFGRIFLHPWFAMAVVLLAVALIAATFWIKQLGFFLAHAGILALLLGAYQTYSGGIEGRLAIAEGETASQIGLVNQEKFTIMRGLQADGKRPEPIGFSFQPGPVNWPEGKTYAWPEENGVKLKVLKYYRHASIEEDWVAAEGKKGEPAIRFAIVDPAGRRMVETWLAGRPLGGAGMPVFRIVQATDELTPEKFLNPADAPEGNGVEFLSAPDGKLYCRMAHEGKFISRGEVKEGSSIEFLKSYRLKILKYLPDAVHKVLPVPVEPTEEETNSLATAAFVEVESGGEKRAVWLIRDEPAHNFQVIARPKEKLFIHYGPDDLPLGFSLKLLKFTRLMNPGRMGNAGYSSTVQVIDKDRGIDAEREISMNHPVSHGRFTFYQSSFDEGGGRNTSVLTAAYDPGRFLKYAGSLLICLGIALRYMTHTRLHKRFQ